MTRTTDEQIAAVHNTAREFYRHGWTGLADAMHKTAQQLETERARADKAEAQAADLKPGRWWRVTAPDGTLWCETSNEREARRAMRPGDRLERMYYAEAREWRPVE